MPDHHPILTPLEHVTRAREELAQARDAYRRAIVHAHEAGVPVATIARAAGVSRQAIAWRLTYQPSTSTRE